MLFNQTLTPELFRRKDKEMTTETAPATSTFCWNELMTGDVEAAKNFYSQLFGWESKEMDMGPNGTYTIFTNGDNDCAGMMKKPEEHVPTSWLSYVTVDDVDASTEKAKDLGANEWQTFRDILIPYMKPGLLAGGLLAFTLSLDDFVITFFTAGPNSITLPVKIFSMIRFSVTPEVNAASTVLIVITVIAVIAAMRLQAPVRERTVERL